jgi:hypothetical protein
MNLNLELWIQFGVFFVAAWALVHTTKINSEKKISRIYERIDEVKAEADEKHVTKEVCKIIQERISADIAEIKTDVKVLLRMSNNDKRSS